jgi:DNA-binding CsgD family transcriptional regulator
MRQMLLQGVPSRQIMLQFGCSRDAVKRAERRITEVRDRYAAAVA